jgi:hypothetical protein
MEISYLHDGSLRYMERPRSKCVVNLLDGECDTLTSDVHFNEASEVYIRAAVNPPWGY